MKPSTHYIIEKDSVVPVVKINDEYLVPANVIFKKRDFKVYDSKLDALYDKLLRDLAKGKSLENFRRSKYFKYYTERLKEENPEYYL